MTYRPEMEDRRERQNWSYRKRKKLPAFDGDGHACRWMIHDPRGAALFRIGDEREHWNIDDLLRILVTMLSSGATKDMFSTALLECYAFEWVNSRFLLAVSKRSRDSYKASIMLPVFFIAVGDEANLIYSPSAIRSTIKSLKPRFTVIDRLYTMGVLLLLLAKCMRRLLLEENSMAIGHPVNNLRVVLKGGTSHAVDYSELAFKLASIYTFRQGYAASKPVILEPVMFVELKVPTKFKGAVVGDINKRKGAIVGYDQEGDGPVITVHFTLNNMFGNSTVFHSA